MMTMIELTNEEYQKFWINATMVVKIITVMGDKSQLNLTNGNYVICTEPCHIVAGMINDLNIELMTAGA